MKKTISILVIFSLFLTSCSNNDEKPTGDFPVSFHFYLELYNTEGSIPSDGEVLLYYPNYFASSTDAIELVVVDDAVSVASGKTLFGDSILPDGWQGIIYGSSLQSPLTENIDNTDYILIHYNESITDTLSIRAKGDTGEVSISYEFRLNGDLLELYSPYVEGQVPNPSSGNLYFNIVKDIEWENTQEN